MAKVLYIHANPKKVEDSFSLSVGQEFLNAYKESHPNDEVTVLDLYEENIPAIDAEVFSGWGKLASGTEFQSLSAQEQAKVARLGELADQFVAHDLYVFVTPVWNFLFPPVVKAYIDSICVAGKTFKYTEQGPIGLLGGKKAVHIQASGSIFSHGPYAEAEMSNKYLKGILGFVGITDVSTVWVEGMGQLPEKAQEFKANAQEEARKLARSL